MGIFQRIITNTISIYLARFIEVFLQLGILAFIISKMGQETYGAALLIISISEIVDLIRGGVGKATIKFIAEYHAKGDYAGTQRVFSSCSVMHCGIGIIGLLVCLIITPFCDTILSVPPAMVPEARIGMVLMGLGILFTFILIPWRQALMAYERYDQSSLAHVTGRILNVATVVACYYGLNQMLVSIVLGAVIGNMSEVLICWYMTHRIDPHLKLRFTEYSPGFLNMIGRYACFDMLHPISTIIYKNGSFFVCAHILSLSAVAGLGIIFNICRLLSYLINEAAQTIIPIASRLDSLGEKEMIIKVLAGGTSMAVCLAGLVLVGMVPLMDSFLSLWLGRSYVYLADAACILLIAESLRSSTSYIHASLSGTGHVRFDGLSDLLSAVIGLGIGIVLVENFNLAFSAFVIALSCTHLIRFLSITLYGAHIYQINMGRLFWHGYLRVYGIVVVFLAVLVYVIPIHVTTWSMLIISGGSTALLFLVACLFTTVSPTDRRRIIAMILGRTALLRQ